MKYNDLPEIRALAYSVYQHINQPYTIGHVWAKYRVESTISAHNDARRLLKLLDFSFKPEEGGDE